MVMPNKEYSSGFFKYFHICLEMQMRCNKTESKKFDRIDTDLESFKFVSELESVKEKIFNLEGPAKNNEKAIKLKAKGNSAFQANNWQLALDFYNQALIITPKENVVDFAILLANRSAVLHHMKQFKLAIKDIQMAAINYPKDKMYKIVERLAKCYLSIGDFCNSSNAFKEVIRCLDESELPDDKRRKSEEDAEMMIKNLQPKIEPNIDKSLSKLLIQNDDADDKKLNDAVAFAYNDNEGRFAIANDPIKIGDLILMEKSHCAVMFEKYNKTHCQHCFLRTIAPLVCPNCPNVIFCSNKCKEAALSSYHKYECAILPLIWRSGLPINCHLALRIMSQKSLQYFIEMKDKLNDNLKFDDMLKLSSEDYRTVFALVRHEKHAFPCSFFQSSLMANFLAYCLRQGNYFSSITTDDNQFTDLYAFIGGLILTNLKILQFNSHGINELGCFEDDMEPLTLGAGLYPTFARFNHSCLPSVLRYQKGTQIYVHAAKSIKPSEAIYDNYGPIFSLAPYDERQQTLQLYYNFDCHCEPCTELWPLCEDMNDISFQFKCIGGSDKNCKNYLSLSVINYKKIWKCNKCNQITDILKCIKAVEQINTMKITAKLLVESGDYENAAEKYGEILTIMEKYVKLPFKDYLIVQKMHSDCLEYLYKNVYFKEQ